MRKAAIMAKKYSLNVENGRVVSVEVDGELYKKAASVPNADDRARLQRLMRSFPKASDLESEEQPDQVTGLLVRIFTGVALVLLLVAVVSGIFTAVSLSKEQVAQGTVVQYSIRRDAEGYELFYPIIEFALPDQTRQTVVLTEGSWPPAYQIGQQVAVAYQEGDPTRARAKTLEGGFTLWLVTLITGVMAMTFGTVVYFIRRLL
jgi:hypothetical protein